MVGKKVRGALYVHRSALPLLPLLLQELVERGNGLADTAGWNVTRLEPEAVAFLTYQSFDDAAFPALMRSTKVNLAENLVTRSDFTRSLNPLILHRKELLVDPSDPRVPRWTETTSRLVKLGIFRDSHLIGRLNAWNNRLKEHGLKVIGDEVIAA